MRNFIIQRFRDYWSRFSFRHILQVSNAIPRRNQRKMVEEFLQGRKVKELLSSSVYYGTLLVNQSPIGRKILRKKKKTR